MSVSNRRRSTLAAACISLSALGLTACGGGGPTTLIVPKGGFANDKSDSATYNWFKAHTAVISSLGGQPQVTSTVTNYSALSASCISFGDAVAVAKKLPHIPNAQAQTLWADVLAQFQAGVENCSTGTVKMDANFLTAAANDFKEGHDTLATLIFGPPTTSHNGA
jgi:hypothetical protein